MSRAPLLVSTLFLCTLAVTCDSIAQTPATTDGWVVLSVDEYNALRTRATPQPPRPAPPPVEATLTRVDYELRPSTSLGASAGVDSLTGRVLLTIDVLRDGWTRVPIPAGFMVREARLDGQPVALLEGPPPHVLLSTSGRRVLTLDVDLPLNVSAGTESIALPASTSPISRVSLTMPRNGVDLSVTGGFIAERIESPTESRWTAFGQPNRAITLAWKRKVDDRHAEQPLRIRARVTSLVGLGEDLSQISAAVRVEVVQGVAREVSLALPTAMTVNQVNGATVGDWDVNAGLLRVRFLDPIATEVSFLIQGDMRAPREGPITVPLVRVPAAERESGGIAVDVIGAGEIAEREARGLDPSDPSDLADVVAGRESPSMIAFRLRPLAGIEPRALDVHVVRYTPQAVLIANVEEARYRAMVGEDGHLLVEARYAVRNNQRGFLKVMLPTRSTVWSAAVAGRPMRPGRAEPDAVLLPLEKGKPGEEAPTFVVELVYLQRIDRWPDRGLSRIELPSLDLPVLRSGVELYYSPRFRLELQSGAFRLEHDDGPFAEALREERTSKAAMTTQGGTSAPSPALRALVDRYRKESGGRTVVGAIPVRVNVPAFGPSMFVASELTAEAQTPLLEFAFKRAN